MIEPIMFFGLGFLVSSLLGLIILPLVHARAVRLTTRRIEASAPVSMAEIQADKDQLRAEFAMSTRRLEMSIEQLKAKTTGQMTGLGKQTEAVNKLKAELGEKSTAIAALNAREKALREQLQRTEDELGRKTDSLREAERRLAEKDGEFQKRFAAADSQRIEIVTLRTQEATLRDRISDLERQVKHAEGRASRERAADGQPPATQTLRTEHTMAEAPLELGRESERMENALLRERINDVSAQVANLTAALEGPDSPIATILANDDSAAQDGHVKGAQNGAAPIALTRVSGSLADRIRALQSRATSRAGAVR